MLLMKGSREVAYTIIWISAKRILSGHGMIKGTLSIDERFLGFDFVDRDLILYT